MSIQSWHCFFSLSKRLLINHRTADRTASLRDDFFIGLQSHCEYYCCTLHVFVSCLLHARTLYTSPWVEKEILNILWSDEMMHLLIRTCDLLNMKCSTDICHIIMKFLSVTCLQDGLSKITRPILERRWLYDVTHPNMAYRQYSFLCYLYPTSMVFKSQCYALLMLSKAFIDYQHENFVNTYSSPDDHVSPLVTICRETNPTTHKSLWEVLQTLYDKYHGLHILDWKGF